MDLFVQYPSSQAVRKICVLSDYEIKHDSRKLFALRSLLQTRYLYKDEKDE